MNSSTQVSETAASETIREAMLSDQYKVILHNDDHNEMNHVVKALIKVFRFEERRAIELMVEAHKNGSAICAIEPLERAELHRDQLISYSLVATIEKA